MFHTYNISMSKICCPTCWELLKVINETNNKVKFVGHAHHSNLYPVSLLTWLSDNVVEKMTQCFKEKLYEGFCQLSGTDELSPFQVIP